MIRKVFFYFIFFSFHLFTVGQTCVYQDVWHGGVKCTGLSTGQGGGVETIDLSIPIGSIVKKIFFFPYSAVYPDSSLIFLNGNNIPIKQENCVTTLNHENQFFEPIKIFHYDITDLLIADDLSNVLVEIGVPCPDIINCGFWTAFFVVLYVDPSMPLVTCSLQVPNKNLYGSENYLIENLNPINTNNPVAFSVFADRACNTNVDGTIVNVQGNQLGIFGGNDGAGFYSCAGSQGCYDYSNNILTGLTNDDNNLAISGTDVLSDISSILNNGVTSFSVELNHVNIFSPPSSKNIYSLFPVSYSSNCDTFSVTVSNDTTICPNLPLQLFATGGQTYEWLPATDLSCSDCPNPIFNGDTSRFYTVRIWNNDSCSVVRPVKVNVRPLPKFGTINSTASHCGTNNGSVSVSAVSGTQAPITYTLNDTLIQTSGTFTNLASGSYTFNLTDGFGCVSKDTIVNVGEINTTVANFTVSPSYGVVPLAVDFTNTSINATDYLWSINGMDQGSNLNSYTCDTSGLYTIQLIAWQNDPSCADTIELTVLAVDQIIIPTAFTPDNDGVNDRWEIPNIKNIYPKHLVRIYNRWGTLIYEAPEGKYSTYPWKGIYEDEALPVGSYYFIIDPNDGVTEVIKGIVSIVR